MNDCPLPIAEYPAIVLAHGGGGRLSKQLLERVFIAAYGNDTLDRLLDSALIERPSGRIAFSTDSYVVDPPFFPGGNIGSLAVHGTINDLAMCGAQPLALSAGYILEEGLAMADLWRIVTAMRDAAAAAGVPIVTGDTKVVDRGKADRIFINTAGIGCVPDGVDVAPARVRAGDVILVSGVVASHGIAIMSMRDGLEFETAVETDSAPLHGLVAALVDAVGDALHALRDPTRGGVASALNEIATAAAAGMRIDEAALPVLEQVRGACEMLGLDPLYVANEGKLIAFVERGAAERALACMRAHPLGTDAAILGEVVADHPGRVVQRSRIGGLRTIDLLSGEQLPRIC
jgi:hydrogenase expression/formation protein HypE